MARKSWLTPAFYQFALALVAMIGLIIIHLSPMEDKIGIANLFSSIVGAGVWGGLQSSRATAKPDNSLP